MRRAKWKLNVRRIKRSRYMMKKPQGHHRFYEIFSHISQFSKNEVYDIVGFENVPDETLLLAEEIVHGIGSGRSIERFRLPYRWRKFPSINQKS